MPTTEDRDKYDADKLREARERKSLAIILWFILLGLVIVLACILIWGWAVSTGGLP